jgi:hypothetical protein
MDIDLLFLHHRMWVWWVSSFVLEMGFPRKIWNRVAGYELRDLLSFLWVGKPNSSGLSTNPRNNHTIGFS